MGNRAAILRFKNLTRRLPRLHRSLLFGSIAPRFKRRREHRPRFRRMSESAAALAARAAHGRVSDRKIGARCPDVGFQQLLRYLAALRGAQVAPAFIDADDVVVGVRLSARNHGIGACWRLNIDHLEFGNLLPVHGSFTGLGPADCGYPCQKPEASSARRETTLQREIAVKNVSLGIFDPSLGIFDPARCRRNPDFWGGFPPKPRSVLRNRQGIPRLSVAHGEDR